MLDSSGGIELFTDGPQASRFVAVLDSAATLVMLRISIFEVFKWVLREHREAQAIQAVSTMHRGLVVDLDSTPCGRSGPARTHQAWLNTMNADFRGLGDDVELIEKQRKARRSGATHGPFQEVSLAHCLSAGCGKAFAWSLLLEKPGFSRTSNRPDSCAADECLSIGSAPE